MAEDNSNMEGVVDLICRVYNEAAGNRSNWESHWEEIAERILPEHRDTLRSNGTVQQPGRRKTEYQFDATPALALSRFTAIMSSILTPENQIWHKLRASDTALMKSRRVRLYFEDVNRILWEHRRRPSANFSGQNMQVMQSLGAYGTGALFVDENIERGGFRYKYSHVGRTYIFENFQGQIDRCLRVLLFTASQLLDVWPAEKLPTDIKDKAAKNSQHRYTVLHYVRPRGTDYDPGRLDARGMPYASDYVLKDTKTHLQSGGYFTFPMPVGRYMQAMDEVYGRSPAMSVLPAVKVLNEQKKTILKQGHRIVDPVLFTHDDGIVDAINLAPGAINPGGVTEDGRPLFATLPTGNLAVGKEMMDDERSQINDAFLITLFQILVDTPAMTATEVLERTREKGILLAPTAGRLQAEYLGSLLPRELDILNRQGILPKMPQELVEAEGEYEIEYDNDLTRSSRAQEAAGFARTVEQAVAIAANTGNPDILDHFNWDAAIPEISAIQGVPERWLRGMQEVASLRQARQQQAETQEDIQSAPGIAALMSSAGKLAK